MYNSVRISKLKSLSFLKRTFEGLACEEISKKTGLVLGAYETCDGGHLLTSAGSKFDKELGGRVSELLERVSFEKGETILFNNLGPEFYAVAVSALGQESIGYNEIEYIEECKENIRIASAAGARALQEQHSVHKLLVESFTNAEASAEGAVLGIWTYDEYKRNFISPEIDLFDDPDREGWERGIVKGSCQNLARNFQESPPNVLTPIKFAQLAIDILCPCGVSVDVRDKDWIYDQKMCCFLAFAQGSSQPPYLLEINYCGGSENDKPIILIGEGVTFDSGGLCLTPCESRSISGGAVVVAVLKALALLGIPVNVTGLIPLCENMPGGMAIKPGDVLTGWNGKTIKVESTENSDLLILSDVLGFSSSFKPAIVMTVASISRETRNVLGTSASGVFSTSDVLWMELARASAETGDRLWRFPLWKHYNRKIKRHDVDFSNVGIGGGHPCLAASFLLEFSPDVDFVLIDNTGTSKASVVSPPYLRQGYMTGRPTRTILHFLQQVGCPQEMSPC